MAALRGFHRKIRKIRRDGAGDFPFLIF